LSISDNIRNYKADQKLQQAALGFIVRNMTKREDIKLLREAFKEFDENKDGRLTKDELIKGLSKVTSPNEAKTEVERIINLIDTDNNGFIEYEEFISASINKKLVLTEENLLNAFQLFDKDRCGQITISTLKQVLGHDSNVSELVWKDMVDKIDKNGDGVISYKEFKDMMKEVIN
jgi:calcium-dependent protein kinase